MPLPVISLQCASSHTLKIEETRLDALHINPRNARTHSAKQVSQIAASIRKFGFVNPILLADDDTVVAGHGRLAAARQLGMTLAPTIRLSHLTREELRSYALADNRLAELAGWDDDLLAAELRELSALDLDFDLEITGFEGASLDDLVGGVDDTADPADDRVPESQGPSVAHQGDVWILGNHRLICGDARDRLCYEALMGGDLARMVFTDPPYNVPIDGHVGGKGKIERRDFVMASGEMSEVEFSKFLATSLGQAAAVSHDGAIHFVCMDWRHQVELLGAGRHVYSELKNLIVWVKSNAGMGTFYRSQHELVFTFKVGLGPHINTFGLGQNGRYRTNVWTYPGVTSFGAARDEELAMHPTVKPVAMVADAIRDVSRRGDIVLDPFGGSGTTLIAAEKTRRAARLIELDPLYCDAICRRWAAFSGQPAVLEASGQTFEATAISRGDDVERGDG